MEKKYTSIFSERYRTLAISCKAKNLLEEIARFHENTTLQRFNRSKFVEKMLEEKVEEIRKKK